MNTSSKVQPGKIATKQGSVNPNIPIHEITGYCPFCHTTGYAKARRVFRGFWQVICDNCDARSSREATSRGADAAWKDVRRIPDQKGKTADVVAPPVPTQGESE